MKCPSIYIFMVCLHMFGLLASNVCRAAEASLRDQAADALRRGVQFFRSEVAVQGTYLWQYSDDQSKREGEGKATATQGWVQPPGTPAVGQAFIAAYGATGESRYVDAARETAHGLAYGQLRSGGWSYWIDFDPASNRPLAYRHATSASPKARNVSTLDDNTTQSALRFLMNADRALQFKDGKIHDAVRYGLQSLLKVQYPNGAWSQGFDRPPEPDRFPIKKASYPESWPRTHPGGEYWRFYTFNDNALADTIELLFEAERIYRGPAAGAEMVKLAGNCRAAAEKAGNFILMAQMPEPQPAWAQQYNFDMHPSWARKFEPPAISGGESQRILRTLLSLYRQTGDRKYLEPVPRALEYLRQSRRPDGRLARFYELRTNRPLYFTKDYKVVYEDDDLPTHYSFIVPDQTGAIAREFSVLKDLDRAALSKPASTTRPTLDDALLAEVKAIIAAQDSRGRWVENGGLRYHGPSDSTTRVIRSRTFIQNIETLSRYLAATP